MLALVVLTSHAPHSPDELLPRCEAERRVDERAAFAQAPYEGGGENTNTTWCLITTIANVETTIETTKNESPPPDELLPRREAERGVHERAALAQAQHAQLQVLAHRHRHLHHLGGRRE